MDPLTSGMPPGIADALATPPEQAWELLEVAVVWPDLVDVEARVAARLRTFVLTRDPLDHIDRSAPAWATVNGDGDNYEVVVYVPLGNAVTLAEFGGTTIAEILARLAESVVTVGAAQERLLVTGAYPSAEARGRADPLLSHPVADLPGPGVPPRSPTPEFHLASAGWEPIGLAAIQDLVQARFGPVDLDRSTVRLKPADTPRSRCPACAGQGFGFPADLQEHLPTMCPTHASEAQQVTTQRLARAARSNRRGWEAIAEGTQRLEQPPPPWSLGRRLRAALEADPPAPGDPDAFRARMDADAQLVLDLDDRFREAGAPFEDLLEGDQDLLWRLADWLTTIVFGLGHAGLGERILPVGRALERLDPERGALHASDTAVALAQQGRPEAVEHAEANVLAHPDDIWVRIHLGDVHRELDDPARAEAAFREAVAQVREHGDPDDVAGAYERLADLIADQPGRDAEVRALQEEATDVLRRGRAATQRGRRRRITSPGPAAAPPPAVPSPAPTPHLPVRRSGPKVGRNEPCPCGSGQKYKRCHGA